MRVGLGGPCFAVPGRIPTLPRAAFAAAAALLGPLAPLAAPRVRPLAPPILARAATAAIAGIPASAHNGLKLLLSLPPSNAAALVPGSTTPPVSGGRVGAGACAACPAARAC